MPNKTSLLRHRIAPFCQNHYLLHLHGLQIRSPALQTTLFPIGPGNVILPERHSGYDYTERWALLLGFTAGMAGRKTIPVTLAGQRLCSQAEEPTSRGRLSPPKDVAYPLCRGEFTQGTATCRTIKFLEGRCPAEPGTSPFCPCRRFRRHHPIRKKPPDRDLLWRRSWLGAAWCC